MIAFLSTWREMGWTSALLLTGVVAAVATMLGIAIADHFSAHKREMRSIRKVRRQRLRAWETLRSTARRDIFREFHGK